MRALGRLVLCELLGDVDILLATKQAEVWVALVRRHPVIFSDYTHPQNVGIRLCKQQQHHVSEHTGTGLCLISHLR